MKRKWLLFSIITLLTWGIWGSLIEIPDKMGFPATLGYIVWTLSMVPCALVAGFLVKWNIEINVKSFFLGSIIGLLGAGGQLILFEALRLGPAYIIFPFISMSPAITILLSLIFLKEKATNLQKFGIVVALIAILFLSYMPTDSKAKGFLWVILASFVFFMWGLQAFVMKFANKTMRAESIFVYMTLMGLILAPIAYYMTDFNGAINYSAKIISLTFLIQILNSIGALTLVYAYRYGNAIIVSPMTGLAPLITIVLSLIIYSTFPSIILLIGLILATIALIILTKD
jgi:drug/metabolite transporter (DMT)-like permease